MGATFESDYLDFLFPITTHFPSRLAKTKKGNKQVEPHTSIPVVSVILTTTIACLLSLIIIGSSIAFNQVISLTIDGLYGSYFMCCSLLLYRRLTGAILPLNTEIPSSVAAINTPSPDPSAPTNLVWGPFHLPGLFGIIVNGFACIYMLVIIFFSFWPPMTPTTAKNMNYTVLVTGAVAGFSVTYYLLWARKIYSGPVIEIVGGGTVGAGVVSGSGNGMTEGRRTPANAASYMPSSGANSPLRPVRGPGM